MKILINTRIFRQARSLWMMSIHNESKIQKKHANRSNNNNNCRNKHTKNWKRRRKQNLNTSDTLGVKMGHPWSNAFTKLQDLIVRYLCMFFFLWAEIEGQISPYKISLKTNINNIMQQNHQRKIKLVCTKAAPTSISHTWQIFQYNKENAAPRANSCD